MPFPGEYYEPETLHLMTQALEEARAELKAGGYDDRAAQMMMVLYIMRAVTTGERDPERLKLIALKAVDMPAPPDDPAGK